jgi:4-diphosphocytidyl-2-C-methyl-D-erythritol kinase
MITVKAPAKINLTLEVLSIRPDGFHEIRSVLQTVDLCDTLRLETTKNVTFRSDMSGWSAGKSLVIKAVDLLKKTTGCLKGVTVEIEKRLPLMSGLGGDSSDAAALLRGLDKLWELGLSSERLSELAAQLGSDVTFFLHGGTALAKGRGEILTPLPALAGLWVVLVMPPVPSVPGKTGRMYSMLMPEYFTDGKMTQKLVETLHKAGEFSPSLLFNTFENIAFKDKILKVHIGKLAKLGMTDVHLAGSGPTLFMMLPGKDRAEDIYRRCILEGMKAYLVNTGLRTQR